MEMKSEIGIVFKVVGFHYYPHAPKQVSFLRDSHRHTFGFECVFSVQDLNRELEFFIMRDKIVSHLDKIYPRHITGGLDFGAMSCEMIAAELVTTFGLVSCKVDEDGENWGKAYGN
jgi:hypothetical protein